jgi:hypothetical protein
MGESMGEIWDEDKDPVEDLVSHYMEVSYPSGQRMSCKGKGPIFLMIEGLNTITIFPRGKVTFVAGGKTYHKDFGVGARDAAMILDPRAVVRLDGVEVYNPRLEDYYEGLTDNWKEWLAKNPWWPGT